MTLTATVSSAYDDPNIQTVRTVSKHGIGGAASTAYGKERFFHKCVVRAIHANVNVADASGSTWQAYYSPVGTPGGGSDVAIGDAWAVTNGAAGTTKTIDLSGLTASGALEVDAYGFPIFNPGDFIYLKTGGSNGSNGRIDAGYEFKWTSDAKHN